MNPSQSVCGLLSCDFCIVDAKGWWGEVVDGCGPRAQSPDQARTHTRMPGSKSICGLLTWDLWRSRRKGGGVVEDVVTKRRA